MSDTTTTLVERGTTRAEWAAFGDFLARPRLPERIAPLRMGSVWAVLRIYALDLLLMGALMLVAGAVIAAGIELPETALAGMEITAGLAVAVVVGAPITEELVFRSWLSGHKRHLLAILGLAIAGLGVFAISATGVAGGGIWALAVMVFSGLLAILLLWTGRHRRPLAWFERLFPFFFWASTLIFACIHLFNFSEGALWVLLPLVLPQFVLGAILGHLRVHYGLWTAILLHALQNGTALVLVWIGTRYAGGN